MHWATYGATVRRMGVFRMNFNEALAQDIFRLISTVWENVFVSEVQKDVGLAVAAIEADFISSHEAVVKSMETAGIALARLEPIKGPQVLSPQIYKSLRWLGTLDMKLVEAKRLPKPKTQTPNPKPLTSNRGVKAKLQAAMDNLKPKP